MDSEIFANALLIQQLPFARSANSAPTLSRVLIFGGVARTPVATGVGERFVCQCLIHRCKYTHDQKILILMEPQLSVGSITTAETQRNSKTRSTRNGFWSFVYLEVRPRALRAGASCLTARNINDNTKNTFHVPQSVLMVPYLFSCRPSSHLVKEKEKREIAKT